MTRGQILLLHLSVALTTLTGVAFGIMKYIMKPRDEFSVVNHPLQPYTLAAHVVIAPLLLFVLGWTFGNHMSPMLRGRRKSPTGVWSLALIAPMVLSAYLLQISTSEAIRKTMAAGHWISSAAFVIVYVGHVITRRARAAGRSIAADDEANVPSPT